MARPISAAAAAVALLQTSGLINAALASFLFQGDEVNGYTYTAQVQQYIYYY